MPFSTPGPRLRDVSRAIATVLGMAAVPTAAAQDSFAPLGALVPPPSPTRTATGRPGPAYWQQSADYGIAATLDEAARSVRGTATITYTNRSPEPIDILWLAAGETGFDPANLVNTAKPLTAGADGKPQIRAWEIAWSHAKRAADARFTTIAVRDADGRGLAFEQREGLLRVPLARPLPPGKALTIAIDWSVALGDFHHVAARGGYEYFPATSNYLFAVGHWFPRVLAFTDDNGWSTEPFLGEGEFSAEFGRYDVAITVPASHIVSATGTLANPGEVLTTAQRARLAAARASATPVFVVTPDEAIANEQKSVAGTKTWRFHADSVRDFAWASSPKFAWDAAGFAQPGTANPQVLAMSFYPYEAAPLWFRTSTRLVRHTLDVYGRHALPYPYPVLNSVNAFSQSTGVEYPMMGFTGPRPAYDRATGTAQFGQTTRDLLAELIIHESGHNWFPMIVNSDERRFAWMDEGVNTFLNHLAALEWEDAPGALFGAPLDQGFARALQAEPRRPLMTAADATPDYFGTTYFKAAGSLMMLRELVLGRDVFDRAFADYARRWAFKRAMPADFFRSIEDASGRKLDWFWRGWFFGTGYFDMAVAAVTRFDGAPPLPPPARAGTPVPETPPEPLTLRGNSAAGIVPATRRDPSLGDYYTGVSATRGKGPGTPPPATQDPWMADTLAAARSVTPYVYGVTLRNVGGLLLPQRLRVTFADGSTIDQAVPVEVWRDDAVHVIVPIHAAKPVVRVDLDPDRLTPDADRKDNVFTGPIATAPILPARPDREDRGAMAADGVAVTREGAVVKR